MFFVHRVLNAVTMMYNEAEELTACHFIRPSTYFKASQPTNDDESESLQKTPGYVLSEGSDDDQVNETKKESNTQTA